MIGSLPDDWISALGSGVKPAQFAAIREFVADERRAHQVWPRDDQVFATFELTPFNSVRAVILGQDPYFQPELACGLAFSVSPDLQPEIRRPLALRRILDELQPDRRGHQPAGATLHPWAAHGVLLLNTVLTVREREAGSHAGHGWEQITGAALEALAAQPGPIVFMLWGESAKRQGEKFHLDTSRHVVLTSAHPSARFGQSHRGGFVGSRPFAEANKELIRRGAQPIDWALG